MNGKPPPGLTLTQACWPMFSFVINASRQIRSAVPLDPEKAWRLALSALHEGAAIAQQEPQSARAWNDRIRAMLIYFVDYRMVNLEWPGKGFWLNRRLETHPEGLDRIEPLGGEKFFTDCDDLRKLYDQAERVARDDLPLLSEQLSLYYTCIRLGFRGAYHDKPIELDEYAQRIYAMLPSQRGWRDDELFPEAYKHTVTRKAVYPIGVPLAIILSVFGLLFIGVIVGYRIAWNHATEEIRKSAETYDNADKAALRTAIPDDGTALKLCHKFDFGPTCAGGHVRAAAAQAARGSAVAVQTGEAIA